MSGFIVKPSLIESGIYNPSNYIQAREYLTLESAEGIFAKLNDSRLTGLSVIQNVVAGTAEANKALVLDGNASIDGINQIQLISTKNPTLDSMMSDYQLCIRRYTTTNLERAAIAFNCTTTSNTVATPACTIGLQRTDSNGKGNFVVSLRPDNQQATALTDRLTITHAGATSINGTLTTNGIIKTASSSNDALQVEQLNASAHANIRFITTNNSCELGLRGSSDSNPNDFYLYSGNSYRLRMNTSGNFGIGTAPSGSRLTVDGQIKNITTSGSFGILAAESNGEGAFMGPNSASGCVFFGSTSTANRIGFWNGSEIMSIGANGCVSIGTTTLNYPLNIATSVSNYITTIHTSMFSNGFFSNQSNVTYNVGLRVNEAASAGAFVARSDRRIKKDITPVPYEMVDTFIEHVDPCLYRLKSDNSPNLGYITQDIIKAIGHGVITYEEEADDLPIEQEGDVENRLLMLQYTRICCLLHLEIKRLRQRITLNTVQIGYQRSISGKMGLCQSAPDVTSGSTIVDSVIVSNSRVHLVGDVVAIPIKDLRTDEASIIVVDRKTGFVRITRGPLHGKLSHDMIVNPDNDSKKEPSVSHMHRESYQL
ncbi:unnamed protein product [Phytophthora lilii]|uniref:Unnamed protein product n=1 Tax=Phytophthora lilii TaxID=2077276 RepID=A0A9W6U2R2_9STRA|nr:unnamed protein product [Phytophthora lilii]